MYAAIDEHLGGRSRGAGIFLLAHSASYELALRMAAEEKGTELLGLELAGTGRAHQPKSTGPPGGCAPRGDRRASEICSGNRLGCIRPNSSAAPQSRPRGPRHEAVVAVDNWAAQDFPERARRVRKPVHFSICDHKLVRRNDHLGVCE